MTYNGIEYDLINTTDTSNVYAVYFTNRTSNISLSLELTADDQQQIVESYIDANIGN